MCPTGAPKVGRPGGARVNGELVRQYRERSGMSREALAEVLGVTPRTLQRVENEGVVGLALLRQVCDVLRVPVIAVLWQDPDAVRASLRSYGLAPGHPPVLLGRDAELAAIAARLTRTAPHTILVLEGPVGIGKTSLAQRLAQDTASFFDGGAIWVRGDVADVQLVQLDIARALGFDAHLPPTGIAARGRDWKQAFATHFWRAKRLVVLDDVTDDALVEAFVSDDQPATILATTRFKHVAAELATDRVAVGPLAPEAIMHLLESGLEQGRQVLGPRCGDPAACAACQASRVMPTRVAECRHILSVVAGMPGVARVVNAVLRRERLTTTSSWLARLELPVRGGGDAGAIVDRPAQDALCYYGGLQAQVSPAAWELFAALGVFGTEPVPLAWAAAAAGDPGGAQAAASELLAAHVVELHAPPDTRDSQPWLRLPIYPAAAARALLGERHETALCRVAGHVLADLALCRAVSVPALARYYRRHHGLFQVLRQGLAAGLGPPPDLGAIAAPEAIAVAGMPPAGHVPLGSPPGIDPARAERLVDLATALAPLLFDQTAADGGTWIGYALLAARHLGDDLPRQGRTYLFAGWWRSLNAGCGPQPGFYGAALEAFRRADQPLSVLACHAVLGMTELAHGGASAATELLGDAMRDFYADSEPSAAHCCLLMSASRLVAMGSDTPQSTRESAALCQLAVDELGVTAERDPYLRALLRADKEAFLRVTGEDNHERFARAVAELRERQPEPWLKAALLAHAACLGAPIDGLSAEAALAQARQELWDCTRACAPENAPRLLWFVATSAHFEVARRASEGTAPLIRNGLAGHCVAATSGFQPLPELCGNDLLLMLSTEATGALLDRAYIELALALAAEVNDGRLMLPALRTLRDLLPAAA